MSSLTSAAPSTAQIGTQSFVQRVYNWMALGLAVTGAVSFYVLSNPVLLAGLARRPGIFYAVLLGELGLVLWLTMGIQRMAVGTAVWAFLFYSALNGVTVSVAVAMYTAGSVAAAFLVSGTMFGAMAAWGHATKRDLSTAGSYFGMAVIGLFIGSLVNMWLQNGALQWVLTYATVGVFVGLTAWDAQKIRRIGEEADPSTHAKAAVIGALALYLDFINLFLAMLRILGKRRD